MSDKRLAAEWEPDQLPEREGQPLGPSELAVKAHWERFLPTLVKELKQEGPLALDTAVRKAWWLTEYHVLFAQHQNPELSSLQAEAMFRDQRCYLPPETRTTPATCRPTTT